MHRSENSLLVVDPSLPVSRSSALADESSRAGGPVLGGPGLLMIPTFHNKVGLEASILEDDLVPLFLRLLEDVASAPQDCSQDLAPEDELFRNLSGDVLILVLFMMCFNRLLVRNS